MKYLWILFIATFIWAQRVETVKVIQPQYITVTLDSTTTATVYYVFPVPQGVGNNRGYAISTTAPTATTAGQSTYNDFAGNGALSISIIPDILTAEESDSLSVQLNALTYNPTWGWDITENDDLYLVFDTPGTYTSTSADWLDWTTDLSYIADVSGVMIPAAGFALVFSQQADDTPGAATTLYVSVWWQK